MRENLDADLARRWLILAAAELDRQRGAIDALNVFPVPDGDTGTNLAATLAAAVDAVRTLDAAADGAALLKTAAHAAVLNARGNSGVIMSQYLRGFAENIGLGGPAQLRACLAAGAELAFAAVAEPRAGTMLTVMQAAAETGAAEAPGGIGDILAGATARASDALAHTPEQLPELARAGVVDAGGRGVVVLLLALLSSCTGEQLVLDTARTPRTGAALRVARESGSAEFAFEVQYLLDASDEAARDLREELMSFGDSVMVADSGSGTWNVHAHVNDVGAAIEAGIEQGRVWRLSVVSFLDDADDDETLLLALGVPSGDGIDALFESEGVQVVDEIRLGELSESARRVVLFPGQRTPAVEELITRARALGVEIAVVPTRSPLQVLAAIAVHDDGRRFQDDVIAMAEAAAATRFAEVKVAEADALTTVGPCRRGDVLGLIDGEVVLIGGSVGAVSLAITDRLLGTGGELITVLVGAGCPPESGRTLTEHVGNVAPFTEVVVYDVGQQSCPLMIGME